MPDKPASITRRQFVAGSASAAAVAAFTPTLRAGSAAISNLRLDAGYVLGSDGIAGLHAWAEPYMSDFKLVRADSFAQGDPRFLRAGARLSIEDVVASSANLPTMRIRAYFEVDGMWNGKENLAFEAWGYDSRMRQASRAIEFVVPVSPERGPRLTLEIGQSAVRTPRPRPVRPKDAEPEFRGFELKLSGDGPKLRRGIYILGIVSEPVAWSTFQFIVQDPQRPGRVLVETGVLGQSEAAFPYVVVLVDHVPPAE